MRLHPPYHFFLAPISLILIVAGVVNVIRNPGWSAAAHLLAAIWMFAAAALLRVYPLKVQDRVIRLEERLRLHEVLPAPLQPRIGELTEGQLIALRFASDAELPDLVPKALDGKWSSKQIKQSVRNWRPDYWRV